MHRVVVDLITEEFRLTGRDVQPIRLGLQRFDADVGLSDLELLILWNAYSDLSCASWMGVSDDTLEGFISTYKLASRDADGGSDCYVEGA